MKKIILAIFISFLLISCSEIMATIGGKTPEYVDFPLGENKQITFKFRSYFKKTYYIALNTEFINGKEMKKDYHDSRKYPFKLGIVGYKINSGKKQEFVNKIITHDIYKITDASNYIRGGYSEVADKKNIAFNNKIFTLVDLPTGDYEFLITDYSANTFDYQTMKTSIGIGVYGPQFK